MSALADGVFGVVDFVPDGDTVVFADGTVVRMLGIDAPETGKDGKSGQYYADESRAALSRLVLGNKVEARIVGKKHDKYGRLLAVILLPDGRNANELQLLGGFAFYYHFNTHPGWLAYTYLGLQRSAMRKEAGFWPRILALPKAQRPWVGFPNSRRAEPARGTRGGVERAGLKWFENLEKAFWQGYAPTRKATPWPIASR
jgi:micrococcal nuclease